MRDVVVRVAALAVAVGMVLGALALRDTLHGDGTAPPRDGEAGDGDAGDPGDGDPPDPSEGPLTVVCVEELAAVCEGLVPLLGGDVGVGTEPAGRTAAAYAAAEAATSAADAATHRVWVTLSPWPAMVDEARVRQGREPVLPVLSDVVARSPLVLTGWRDRLAVLESSCGAAVSWGCVGDAAAGSWSELGGDPRWGPVKPGHLPPDASASGLLVTAQAVADRVGRVGFSLRDLQDDAFRAWFGQLEGAVPTFSPSAGTPFRQMLQFGVSSFDVVGTLEAEPAALLPVAGSRGADVVVLYPEPALVADVVVAGSGDAEVARVAGVLGSTEGERLLAEAGWRLELGAPPGGLPDGAVLVEDAGLPAPGALEALQTVWTEVVR